jgi:hypothetical protein
MRQHPAILHLDKAIRSVFRRKQWTDDGDTLIEVLLALIVLGLATVALMIAFGTSISASAEHRNLTTVNNILASASQQAIADMQMTAQQNLFGSCQSATAEILQLESLTTPYTPWGTLPSSDSAYTVQFVPLGSSSPYPVEWWNETGANAGQFTSTCPATYVNQPQMFTISVTIKSSGATYYESFVVTLPQASSGTSTSTSTGPVTQLAFVTQPDGATSGGTQTTVTAAGAPIPEFTVAAENSAGQPVNTDFSDVTLTLSGGAAGAALTGCVGSEDLGYVYFSGCTISLTSASNYVLTATDPSDTAIIAPAAFTNATSYGFKIAATGLSLVYVVQPNNLGISGSPFTASEAPEVAVENSAGVIQTGSSWAGTVTLTSSGGTATDPTLLCPGFTSETAPVTVNTYSITFASGPAKDEFTLPNSSTAPSPSSECTFSGGIRTSVGGDGNALPTSYVLFATAAPATGQSSVSSATSTPFSVSGPGAASQLVFSTEPTGADGATADSPFVVQPVVTVEDAFGNVVYTGTGSNDSIKLTISSGTLTCTSTTTVAASAGVATFAGCAADAFPGPTNYANNLTLTATTGSGASQVSVMSNMFSITPTPNLLVFTTEPVAGQSGTTLLTEPVVTIYYSTGGPSPVLSVVTAASAQMSLSVSGGSLTTCSGLTPEAGVVTVQTCSFAGIVGTQYTMTATEGSVSATSTDFSPTVAGIPTQLIFTTDAPSPLISGDAFGTGPVVTVEDSGGNVVTGASPTITFSSSPASGSISSNCDALSATSGLANLSTCTFTGVGGTIYTLTASLSGVTSAMTSFTVITPPVAPAAPSGVAVSPTSITLNWAAPSSNGGEPIIGYQVDETNTTTTASYTDVCPASDSSTSLTCTITGLTAGDSYTYTVAGINEVGLGVFSPASSTISIVPPNAPTAPSATIVSPTSVTVTWSPPVDNGPAITGYEVNDTNTTTTATAADVCASSEISVSVTCTVTGLTTGDSYTFTVAGINVVATGPFSPASSSVSIVPPNAPSAPTAAVASATSATVNWSAPTDLGPVITGYQVNLTNTTTSTTATDVCAASETSTAVSCTVTGLTTGDIYTFTVAGINLVGTGNFSPASTPLMVNLVPGTPNAPTATVAGPTSATVTWVAPSDPGTAITGYQVNDTNTTTTVTATNVCPSSKTSATVTCNVTGLITGDSYTFTVAAINTEGTGNFSAASSAIAIDYPNAPTKPSATVVGPTSVTVTWSAPGDTGPAITGYQINDTNTTTTATATDVCPSSDTSTTVTCTVTGLTTGDTYTFTVAAINIVGTGAFSPASTAVSLVTPNTPNAPTATVTSASSVTVNWSAPSDTGPAITGYQVNDTDTTTSATATDVCPTSDSSTAVNCSVTGLTPGDTYTFTVAAINIVGTGNFSAASTGLLVNAVPGTPAAPTAAGASSTSITVTWVAPTDTGTAIIGYQVNDKNVTTSATGTNVCVGSESSSTVTCTVTGLTAGDSYTFTVAAINSYGTGSFSPASNAVLLVVPGKPAAPTTSVASATSATVNWVAPTDSGPAISGYQVNDDNTTTATLGTDVCGPASDSSTALTCTATGLTPGDHYTFTVAAINAVGTGLFSNASTSLLVNGVPGTPAAPTTTVASATSASITWVAPSDPGTAIIGYQVNDTNTTTSTNGTNVCTGSTTSTAVTCTKTGLIAGDTYTFTVAAINTAGTGTYSPPSTPLLVNAVPGTPNAPTATGATPTSITVTWNTPSDTGTAITGYEVNDTNTTTTVTATDVCASSEISTSVTCAVSGLTTGDSYTFTVAAINIYGTGTFSPASNAVSLVVPGTPAAPTAVAATGTSATVTWLAPTDTGPAIYGYEVNDTNTTTTATATNVCPSSESSTTVSCTVTGLTLDDTYTFTVAAINVVGTSPFSTASTGLLVNVAPGTPAAPTITVTSATAATVTWAAPSNTGTPITGYQVNDDNTTTSTVGTDVCASSETSTTVTCSVAGLTTGDTYTFTVAAINTAGTGAFSPASTAVSLTVPGTPAAPTLTKKSTTSIEVSWLAPTGTFPTITGYEVDETVNGGATIVNVCPANETEATPLNCTLTGLTNGDTYKFTVAAINVVGTSPFSTASAGLDP